MSAARYRGGDPSWGTNTGVIGAVNVGDSSVVTDQSHRKIVRRAGVPPVTNSARSYEKGEEMMPSSASPHHPHLLGKLTLVSQHTWPSDAIGS